VPVSRGRYDLEGGCFVFFFQAEDGIRDLIVTGVQTCALPILRSARMHFQACPRPLEIPWRTATRTQAPGFSFAAARNLERSDWRSEERRVGKECRSRSSPILYNKPSTNHAR